MQQASALLTPGRTNPSLRGQTRRLPGKTKWAAARLTTTRAKQPKDARRSSRLSPHASVGAGADDAPSDDTHDDKTAFTILARNSPGVLQVRRRVTHFKRPKYLAAKVTLTVPAPSPPSPNADHIVRGRRRRFQHRLPQRRHAPDRRLPVLRHHGRRASRPTRVHVGLCGPSRGGVSLFLFIHRQLD